MLGYGQLILHSLRLLAQIKVYFLSVILLYIQGITGRDRRVHFVASWDR